MQPFFEFIKEFLGVLWGGIKTFFLGMFNGIIGMFNFPAYGRIFMSHVDDFRPHHWVMAVLFTLLIASALVSFFALIVVVIRKYVLKKRKIDHDHFISEVVKLKENIEVMSHGLGVYLTENADALGMNRPPLLEGEAVAPSGGGLIERKTQTPVTQMIRQLVEKQRKHLAEAAKHAKDDDERELLNSLKQQLYEIALQHKMQKLLER
jgi:hypothetical protein